jgi:hypothetical protein
MVAETCGHPGEWAVENGIKIYTSTRKAIRVKRDRFKINWVTLLLINIFWIGAVVNTWE